MVNSYDTTAVRIREYLDENNLGEFIVNELERKYEDFNKLFSLEVLSNLEGEDVRDKIFLHDGDKNNLCYTLEASDKYKGFCGGIRGGSAYKFPMFKRVDSGKWTLLYLNKKKV